jgi:hypothetical protein
LPREAARGRFFQHEAAGPCPQGGVDVLVEVEGGQDEDLDLGGVVVLLDLPGGLDPVLAGHADVHEHDVRVVPAGQGDRLGPVAGLAEDGHAGGGVDQDPEAAPDQRLVVRDDHADGHETACPVGMRASTRNPEAVGSATSLPP